MLEKNIRPAWKVSKALWKVSEHMTSLRGRCGTPSRLPSSLLAVMKAEEREAEDYSHLERKGLDHRTQFDRPLKVTKLQQYMNQALLSPRNIRV